MSAHTLGMASLRTYLDEHATSYTKIEDKGDGEWAVTFPISGGYSIAFGRDSPWRVRHIVGLGNGESLTVHLVERR